MWAGGILLFAIRDGYFLSRDRQEDAKFFRLCISNGASTPSTGIYTVRFVSIPPLIFTVTRIIAGSSREDMSG